MKEIEIKTPFDAVLPPLSSMEFDALRASVESDGVRVPIFVDEAGNILDGHHRYKLAPNAPRKVIRGLTDAGKVAFVLSSNMHRRNLSPEQKAELRAKQIEVAAALKTEGRTQEDIARLLGVDQSTVARWITPDMQAHKERETLDARVKLTRHAKETIAERIEAGESQAEVAADFGVAQQTVSKVAKSEKKRRKREEEIEEQREAIERGDVSLSVGPFDVIVLDPPWPYGTRYEPEGRRAANPYPEMSLAAIREDGLSEVRAKAAPDCVLWLWTTHQFMRHAFPLLDAWGFDEKAVLTWVKPRMGLGAWLRSRSEFCIMAVRGSPAINLTNQTTVLEADARQHSRKPVEFYALVEALCLGPRRYDRFAREPRDNWFVGGNDAERFAA